ncbi:hypothetical protein EDB19DRAFT_1910621 [Suillus lakei]|nr:hypothetical protein EDB19DRAFT_1910621 [Suillus lakei]
MSEELEWLQNELPEFLKMQKDQKLTCFYKLLFPRWFSLFPECLKYWKPTGNPPHEGEAVVHQNDDSSDTNSDESHLLPLTPEQEAELEGEKEIRRKKLREWFWNHTKGKTTLGNMSTSKAFAQPWASVLAIQSLVKDNIQQNQLDLKKRIGIVQKYTNTCFAAELEEVKAEIHEETTRINASRRLGGIGSGKRTKEEIYCAIQELPIVLGQTCEDLAVLMGGWNYTLIMGGPDPMCQGDVMTLSFHHGKGQDGLSFKASNPNFHEQYLAAFEKHLRTVFVPSDSASPAQNNSEELPSSVEANSDLNAGPNFSGMHAFPHGSLMDPNFPVSEADIEQFITSICSLTVDSTGDQWWHSQSQDMQMAVPPLINPPLAEAGSSIELPMQSQNNSLGSHSSTPPCIRRPCLNAFPSPFSMSPQLPSPLSILPAVHIYQSTLPATHISQSPPAPPAAVVSNLLEHSTPATANSDTLPSVFSIPTPLTDTTAIHTMLDALLHTGSVPPTSSAPGRHSVCTTRPSTRAEDANKIGDNAKPITSKHKRKGVTAGSTAHAVAAKKSKK